jgi:hypothetical protein
MSVSCWIAYADRVVTRMTVWDDMPNSLNVGRAIYLSHCAYESRMKRPPPERTITIAGKDYAMPHILGLRYTYDNGNTHTMDEREVRSMLLWGAVLLGIKDEKASEQ